MTRKPYRLAATVLAVLLAAPFFTSCKEADQAIDCGKRAISIAGDVQDLSDAAGNVGQIVDDQRRQQTVNALKKLVDDAKKVRQDGGGKLDKAADKLVKAVDNAIDQVNNDKQPDLGAIAGAAGEVTKACAGA
ncbi:hypothetical protein [Kitasatospora xanthocidica]|uniref:hypothetical protein n=1 Tax=Kitasatospora xanthocidica TaxID=83382 RepID=UPI001678320E|nr:hypothetical protein [Kitasatospora xanthocidica]